MRAASCLAAILSSAATPAFATSTIHCTSPQNPTLELYISVGNGEGGGVDYVQIIDGPQEIGTGVEGNSPRISQNLVNRRQLSFRITDSNANRLIASLDARAATRAYVGTFRYRGRAWRVRCRWDEDAA